MLLLIGRLKCQEKNKSNSSIREDHNSILCKVVRRANDRNILAFCLLEIRGYLCPNVSYHHIQTLLNAPPSKMGYGMPNKKSLFGTRRARWSQGHIVLFEVNTLDLRSTIVMCR